MSLLDRIARVARGRVQLMTKGPSEPLDPAVEAEIESLRPAPAPAETTRRSRRAQTSPARDTTARNPAEEPVPRTDLLGERTAEAPRGAPPKKSL